MLSQVKYTKLLGNVYIQNVLKLFQSIETENMLPNVFLGNKAIIDTKLDKDIPNFKRESNCSYMPVLLILVPKKICIQHWQIEFSIRLKD